MSDILDFVIVGSGFGGSVSALRLTEKGYRVRVLERGKRFRDEDFARTNWNVRKALWAPALRCFGILQISPFRDVFVLHGSGVGGGSLGYANVLMAPGDEMFSAPAWSHLADWKSLLLPHYDTAQAHARRGGESAHLAGRRPAQGNRGRTRDRRHLATHAGRDLLRPARRRGRGGARPLLRRRGPRPRGLHPLRRVHGRVPVQREEHAGQELPVPGREVGRRGGGGGRGARHRATPRGAARRGAIRSGLSVRLGAVVQGPAADPHTQRDRVGGGAGHAAAAVPVPGRDRLPAPHLAATRRPGPHQQRVAARRHRARRHGGLLAGHRHHLHRPRRRHHHDRAGALLRRLLA